jgi:polysaccharide export outer membrane protein
MAAPKMKRARVAACTFVALFIVAASVAAQAPAGNNLASGARANAAAPTAAPAVTTKAPKDYVIGPNDTLSIVFWREKDLTSEVLVRPDGKITLPLLNDLPAAGCTPEQLRARLTEEARKFFAADPVITVVVKQVANNRAFITGQVARPGAFELTPETNVLQVIALAGGLLEFADGNHISILRNEGGVQRSYQFNYSEVVRQKKPGQNIVVRPGDTIIVP